MYIPEAREVVRARIFERENDPKDDEIRKRAVFAKWFYIPAAPG